MSLFILSESTRGHLLARSDSPLGQKSVMLPTRLIPRDELGAPLLDPMEITVRETLLTALEKDSLYSYWYARFSTLRWVQSAPQGLEIPLKRTRHTSHLDRMVDLLVEMKKTAQQVHACFESYKTVVRTYQILDDGFAKRENQQSELWQDLLQDLFERLEDLYMLAFVFVGPNQDDTLPLEIYKNIGYARSWMGLAWKELMQCHVFLKLNFFDVDGGFGKLREPANADTVTSSLESLTLELSYRGINRSSPSLEISLVASRTDGPEQEVLDSTASVCQLSPVTYQVLGPQALYDVKTAHSVVKEGARSVGSPLMPATAHHDAKPEVMTGYGDVENM